jgi:hypothetical protein
VTLIKKDEEDSEESREERDKESNEHSMIERELNSNLRH